MKCPIQCCVFLFSFYVNAALANDSVSQFITKYCHSCHQLDDADADRRFDNLPGRIETIDDLERFQEIVDQLNLGQMPPKDSIQPSPKQVVEIVLLITKEINSAHQRLKDKGSHAPLRRLNSWEYRHTIGDLLGINTEGWDPTENFPEESVVDGFDNNAAELVTSGILLDHYLNAAEEVIQRATVFEVQPETETYRQTSPFYFSGKSSQDLPKLFQVDRFRFVPDTPYTDLYGRHYRGGHIGFLPLHRQGGVPFSGRYTVRVQAAAVGRFHNYDKAIDDFRNGDPLVLELAAVDRRGSVTSTGNVSRMVSLARVELTHEDPRWYEWDVYIEKGFEPEIRFRNGPAAAKRMVRLLTTLEADKPEFKPYVAMKGSTEKGHGVLKAYQGPRLRIWEIDVEGPHIESWPPRSHTILYGQNDLSDLNRETILQRINDFAHLAFRRAPLPGELDPIRNLVKSKLNDGLPPLEALQLGFQSVLCSPGFLYLNFDEGQLSEISLASRLSYFLWSAPPDQELLELATDNKLRTQLTAQVARMLADPRADRFVIHFVRRWLDLDHIGTMPPSQSFTNYYRDNLGDAMRQETLSFFKHILQNNLPVTEFLTAEYTFLNRELALHYGIDNVEGNEFRRVSLADSTQRGGLVTHGTFLTASANGVDTSPVLRGIFVLDKILGNTPPPPPPDVPSIEPDIRGALTIRELLEKHRSITTCAQCHRKIDPLGFALENFDAIGRFRNRYDDGTIINPSGSLPDGEQFGNIHQFRKLLMKHPVEFTRNLTQKLMTYALGRQLGVTDRPAVDAILANLETSKAGLQDLILLIVSSNSFQTN